MIKSVSVWLHDDFGLMAWRLYMRWGTLVDAGRRGRVRSRQQEGGRRRDGGGAAAARHWHLPPLRPQPQVSPCPPPCTCIPGDPHLTCQLQSDEPSLGCTSELCICEDLLCAVRVLVGKGPHMHQCNTAKKTKSAANKEAVCRWLRFPCCGARFPCDLCHEEATDGHEMKCATPLNCTFEQTAIQRATYCSRLRVQLFLSSLKASAK